MKQPKQSQRKAAPNKLEPIDWREFANDAVLNGNMSTLFQRPPSEDPSAYASEEALVEIGKRNSRVPSVMPTVGIEATVGTHEAVGANPLPRENVGLSEVPEFDEPTVGIVATVGPEPTGKPVHTVGADATASAHASTEAALHSEEAGNEPEQAAELSVGSETGVGIVPTVVLGPTGGLSPADHSRPTVGSEIPMDLGTADGPGIQSDPQMWTVGLYEAGGIMPTVGFAPTVGPHPQALPGGPIPTVGLSPSAARSRAPEETASVVPRQKVKMLRSLPDALTLAGNVLYQAMYGPDDAAGAARNCTKGYRELAAITHLDKDTVRDLITEFKEKGIVREIATYDPNIRLAKTYEVLAPRTILAAWREAGLAFVTGGRRRPLFCDAAGELLHLSTNETIAGSSADS